MPSIQRQPEDSATSAPPPPVSAAGTDHLRHLPKMSPTAGVGTEEYVAISVPAVFALLLGFASILALMEAPFVVIALAGIVVAIVALVQIPNSNGTQSGEGMAVAGLFLAVGITSFVLAADVMESWGRSHDRAAIKQVTELFGKDLNVSQFDAAYDLFSQHFKARVSRQEFVQKMSVLQDELRHTQANVQGLGIIHEVDWNGLATFYADPDSGTVTADTYIDFKFTNTDSVQSVAATFRKVGDDWTIDSLPSMFPPKR
jgi:hypothetical protein